MLLQDSHVFRLQTVCAETAFFASSPAVTTVVDVAEAVGSAICVERVSLFKQRFDACPFVQRPFNIPQIMA